MAKCICKGYVVKRVSDAEAHNLTSKHGYEYISKTVYKRKLAETSAANKEN